jgi:deazaflavin-dependent oxidoreductase (nitroreductase family)
MAMIQIGKRIVAWRLLALGLLLFPGSLTWVRGEEARQLTPADLQKVADQSTLQITTIGRKSGKFHTRPIWFVYDQGKIYLQAGREGSTDWYKNLQNNPAVTLTISSLVLKGQAHTVQDKTKVERIHDLFRQKYLRARVFQLFGSFIGQGEVVEVHVELQP